MYTCYSNLGTLCFSNESTLCFSDGNSNVFHMRVYFVIQMRRHFVIRMQEKIDCSGGNYKEIIKEKFGEKKVRRDAFDQEKRTKTRQRVRKK